MYAQYIHCSYNAATDWPPRQRGWATAVYATRCFGPLAHNGSFVAELESNGCPARQKREELYGVHGTVNTWVIKHYALSVEVKMLLVILDHPLAWRFYSARKIRSDVLSTAHHHAGER